MSDLLPKESTKEFFNKELGVLFIQARPYTHIIHLLLFDEQVESDFIKVRPFIQGSVGLHERWLDPSVANRVYTLAHVFIVLFCVVP